MRICPALRKKEENDALHRQPALSNPFLPHDPKVQVTGLIEYPNHVVLLNKFSLLPSHLLVITRHYEAQTDRLTSANFGATLETMRLFGSDGEDKDVDKDDDKDDDYSDGQAVDWLAFYNSGAAAGASQHHRHFQAVPFPAATPIPIEAALPQPSGHGTVGPYSHFHHHFYRFTDTERSTCLLEACHREYEAAMLGMPAGTEAYNILLTTRWLLVVPRRMDPSTGAGPQMNALAFAGCLMVRSEEEYRQWRVRAEADPHPFSQTTIPIR